MLLLRAAFHDIGEVVTGEPPLPLKMNNPVLKHEYDKLEEEASRAMCLAWGLEYRGDLGLPPLDRQMLKMADIIEMMEKGVYETNLGDRYAERIVQRTYAWIHSKVNDLPELKRKRVRDYVYKRLREYCGPLFVNDHAENTDGQDHPFGYDAEQEKM